jgi:hypothetical protein
MSRARIAGVNDPEDDEPLCAETDQGVEECDCESCNARRLNALADELLTEPENVYDEPHPLAKTYRVGPGRPVL